METRHVSIVRHSGGIAIPVIGSKRDFKFGNTCVRSRGMVELMLLIPGSALDIPVIPEVAHVEIPALHELEALEGKNSRRK